MSPDKNGDDDDAFSAKSNQSSSAAASSNAEMPAPPDGGWGWFVVFGSFMIHVVADGITYSFGMFVVELMEVFGCGRGSVSFIPSILVGVTLGCGPIASSFTNRYGCRVATIVGAVVAAAGMAISAAASSIALLYVSIGLCTGIGFGLIYLPAIVSVSMYFEKRRAFATGIAVCGSGLGTFIMAPVTKGLISGLGLQGAFLVLSAIVLTNCFFGALFRPLSSPTSSSSSKSSSTGSVNAEIVNVEQPTAQSSVLTTAEDNLEGQKHLYSKKDYELPDSANGSFSSPPEIKINGETVHLRQTALPPGATPIGAPLVPLENGGVPTNGYNCSATKGSVGNGSSKYSEIARMAFSHPVLLPSQHSRSNPRRYSRHAIALQEDQKRALSLRARNRSGRSGPHDNEPEEVESMGSQATDEELSRRICGCFSTNSAAAEAFKDMMDLSLLKDGVFIMFAVSNFLTSIGFNAPYVYTVDRAKLLNLTDPEFLLSVIGIANTLGRIILGYISDRPWVNRLYLYNACLAVCGLALAVSNFCTDYTSQAVFCAVFGVTSGAYVGLTSVVLVDLLGLDKLTNAFGLLLLFQGIASVLGPPIIGLFYDHLNSYDVGFYFAGAMVFLSGIMLFAIPLVRPQPKNGSRYDETEIEKSLGGIEKSAPPNSSYTNGNSNNNNAKRNKRSCKVAGEEGCSLNANQIPEADEEEEEEGWDNAPPMTMTAAPGPPSPPA